MPIGAKIENFVHLDSKIQTFIIKHGKIISSPFGRHYGVITPINPITPPKKNL